MDPAADTRRADDLYEIALKAGRLYTWETDMEARTRTWTEAAAQLFQLDVPVDVPIPMGDPDHLLRAFHPEDQHILAQAHAQFMTGSEVPVSYRIRTPDGQVRFMSGRGVVVERGPDRTPRRVVHIISDVTDKHEADERNRLLVGELTHRARNLLTIISAISRQTARNAATIEEFVDKFSGRLMSLSRSIDMQHLTQWAGAPLRTIVANSLDTLLDDWASRVDLQGPELMIGPHAAQTLALAFHELATNALKHGSLSVPEGRVAITVTRTDDRSGGVSIRWTEHGGPTVAAHPERTGFGHAVVKHMVEAGLQADVALDYAPEGFGWMATTTREALLAKKPPMPD